MCCASSVCVCGCVCRGCQAEDRCHRLGQSKPVTVYRLVTQGTVDENIHAIAERKLRLDAAVLDTITTGCGVGKAAAGPASDAQVSVGSLVNGFGVYDGPRGWQEVRTCAAPA
jgi:hypothetical protein